MNSQTLEGLVNMTETRKLLLTGNLLPTLKIQIALHGFCGEFYRRPNQEQLSIREKEGECLK